MATRERATVLAIKDGDFLIVKDKGSRHWSLPGGGIEKGEKPEIAASRELHEELGLRAKSVKFLASFPGQRANHHVFVIRTASDRLVVDKKELSDAKWIPLDSSLSSSDYQGHVLQVLRLFNRSKGIKQQKALNAKPRLQRRRF